MNAPAFTIKSAQLMLLALIIDSPNAQDLATRLKEYLSQDPDFFQGKGAVLDLQNIQIQSTEENSNLAHELDFAAFSEIIQQHGMRLVAVRGGHGSQMQAAASAGLLCAPDSPKSKSQKIPADLPEAISNPRPTDNLENPNAIIREVPVEVPVVRPTQVVQRTLRSGQQLYAQDANLVLIGGVSAGAEVIADGDVHVYGPLRGRAVAGARGQTQARIFCTQMQPELLSIAGNYRAFADGLPSDIDGQSAQAWLDENQKLFIAALHGPK